jgi:competence protein ComEA
MELVALLVFLIGFGGILVVAKRGAERAREQREQRWSRIPAVARPAMPLSGSARSMAAAARPNAMAPPQAPASAPVRPGSAPASASSAGPPTPASTGRPAPHPRGAPASRPRTPPPIDVNAATVEQLRTLPGVGVRAAERIVEHRERHGPFPTLDALEAVEGFDQHRVSRLSRRARV